jgi:hypothetical protein
MTTAITKHNLSKLDLFTPNALHPNLPRLNYGYYMCMGGQTMMISEPDVLARKEMIHGMLAKGHWEPGTLRRRIAAHDRIAEAMGIAFLSGRWVRAERPLLDTELSRSTKKYLRTEEDRKKYVKENLEIQWVMMGKTGYSEATAIAVD